MEIEAKKCTLGKRKGSNQHRFVDCCLLSFPRFVHPTVYITIKGLYTSTKGCIDPFPYCMMSSGRSTFCCLIFRLGGTGLGLTEEVEDVGDLHRGELLAVLAVTGGGELLEKVGDALDPSHQVSTGYCWSSIGKIQES